VFTVRMLGRIGKPVGSGSGRFSGGHFLVLDGVGGFLGCAVKTAIKGVKVMWTPKRSKGKGISLKRGTVGRNPGSSHRSRYPGRGIDGT